MSTGGKKSTHGEELVPVTVRYRPSQLQAINKKAAKLGLDRANFIRAAIAEHVEWEPVVAAIEGDDEWIPVTIRMPRAMFEAVDAEARRKALDRGSFCRMWSLDKTDWEPE